ncbi:MAG TPA: FG-GAP-like repeat-containing protein [Candidatus Sulfomarinibacteraceae bacterium]|nr:FG-GAP-like repeat-containing protein [Candidatus Sulfomarinibacteraceae bacterium]
MTGQIRLPAKALSLVLFLLVPALLVAAQRAPDRQSPELQTPAGAALFTDSGQRLGNAGSRDVALGDVDGDGDLDALVVNSNANLVLWLNEGGIFTASDQDLGGYNGNAVALHDLDGDGDLDAVVVLNAPGDALLILINQGPQDPGDFVSSGQTVSGTFNDVAVGDLDGDGRPDLFLTSSGLGNQVWLNNGGDPVQFTDSDQRLGTDASQGVALGDVDGDGDLDAFVANTLNDGNAANRVWINQGGEQGGTEGIFASGQGVGDTNSMAVALGDVDGDGDLDALAVNSGLDRLWLNAGDGTFVDSGQSLDAELSNDGALTDLDGDGDLDAFVVNFGGNTVWLNAGDGTFTAAGPALGDSFSYGLALGDVDGDGDVDAFVANTLANLVWVNQGSPVSGADVQVSLPPTDYREALGTACLDSGASFEVTVRNAGPETATNVTVHARRGNFEGLAGASTYNFGALLPGESDTVQLRNVPGTPTQTGTIYCIYGASVRVTAEQEDPDRNNNASQSEVVVYSCNDLCSIEAIFCGISAPNGADEAGVAPARSVLRTLQEEVIDLLVYFYVRDRVLATTQDGQHYIELYETHDAEIQTLLQTEEGLEAEAVDTLQLWEPNLWALVRGKGDSASITAGQVTAVDNFLESLSAVASPALQQTIAAERDRLPPPEAFVGMTMEEARGVVVGYGIFAPMIVKE